MARKRIKRGAVFLDRDGVINVYPENSFVTQWSQFRFLPGSLGALRRLREKGKLVIVVSNQSAVGRGIMTQGELREITQRMLKAVRGKGGKVHAVYYCPHHPQDGCPCRKPRLGMLYRAARRFSIDLKGSYVIGDNATDILMGKAAGCKTILVLTGKENRNSARNLQGHPHRILKNLSEAVRWILRQPT